VVSRYATATTRPGDGERLARWIDMVGGGRGACRHPDGVTRMLLSAIGLFRDEFEDHARLGPCARCAAPTRLLLPVDGRLRVAA
jgi:NADH:ubiquinone oxidoreductase subunit F (NADH-binding)